MLSILLSTLLTSANLYGGSALYPDLEPAWSGGVATTDMDLAGYNLYPNQSADPNSYLVYNADDRYDLVAGGAVALRIDNSYILINATIPLQWGSLTKLLPNADGNLTLSNNAGTQGVLLDTSTADGYLYLYDESGGAMYLAASRFYSGGSHFRNNLLTMDGPAQIVTSTKTGTANSEQLTITTGDQTNAGDYRTGNINIASGDTTTDGDTGNINIYSGVAGAGIADAGDLIFAVNGAPGVGTEVLRLSDDGSGNALLRFGGTTSSYPALKRDGDALRVRLGDDSGAANIYAAQFLAAASGRFSFVGRSELDSPSDGDLILVNDARSQGIKLDTSTTDGALYLYDESGGDLKLFVDGLRNIDSMFGAAASVMQVGTLNTSGSSSGDLKLTTGNQLSTGDTGDIWIYTGSGGINTGDIVFTVNGAPGVGTTMLTFDASDGDIDIPVNIDSDGIATWGAAGLTSNSRMQVSSTGEFEWATLSILSAPADGDMILQNQAKTQGIKFDTSTADGELSITDESGGDATLNFLKWESPSTSLASAYYSTNRLLVNSYGLRQIFSVDQGVAGDAAIQVRNNDPGRELVASSGTQYVVSLEQAINQSGTASAVAHHIEITDTASGSGQDYLGRWDWGADALFEFMVEDDGDTFRGGDPKGALDGWYEDHQDVTFANDASKSTTGTFIPDGARNISVVGRVTTALTGCTSVDVGDSATVNAFADDLAIAQGTTFDTTDQTVSLSEELVGDEVTVTANDVNCTAGTVHLVILYFKPSAPTSN